jgi:hypothetical protein
MMMESAATKEFNVRYPKDGEQSIIIKSNSFLTVSKAVFN